jgi:hypothetical protein
MIPETTEETTEGGLPIRVLLADLVEHWERRCVALDKLVEDAKKTASDETIARLQGKASMARSMTVELKREIRPANAKVDLPDTAAQDSASKSNNTAVSG